LSLKTRLGEDLKNAMRSRDALRRSVLRLVLSAAHNEEIAKQTELDDEGITGVLVKQAQQRRESIEAYTQGERQDLADQEKAELEIIMAYLPEQMSREDVAAVVKKAIAETGAAGPQDMGKVMSRVMPEVRGKAQGREVSDIASELLKGAGG
jgi:uncharacterized protein YqeY